MLALDEDGRVSRLRPGGAPDPSFRFTRPKNAGVGDTLRPAAGGGFFLVGASGVRRFRADGRPDPAFGRHGRAPGVASVAFGAAVRDGNALVVLTRLRTGTLALTRVTSAGQRDPAFAGGGDLDLGAVNPAAIARDPSGALLAADGTPGVQEAGEGVEGRPAFTTARYLGSGGTARAVEAPCRRVGRSVTCTFDAVGLHLWRVPAGVTAVRAEVAGAQGGGAAGGLIPGGLGGVLAGTVPVVAGDVLSVVVGGRGADGVPGPAQDVAPGRALTGSRYPGPQAPGGAGGPGDGGAGGAGPFAGGGGGGASSLGSAPGRSGVLLIAGGGGGAALRGAGGSGGGAAGTAGAGGGGGGATRRAGGHDEAVPVVGVYVPPIIGDRTIAGPRARPAPLPLPDPVTTIADVVNSFVLTTEHSARSGSGSQGGGPGRDSGGGGGGGGWYGGGGGAAPSAYLRLVGPLDYGVAAVGGSGGGGSGWACPSAGSVHAAAGVRTGDGLVVLTYRLPD